jgi:nitrite reductase/ring-hydroxylating ferredoxin subunit
MGATGRRTESTTGNSSGVAVSILDAGRGSPIVPFPDSSTQPLAAPYPDDFARYPQSWYVACPAHALPRGAIRRISIAGRVLALFRGEDGRAGALPARCPHLGADLSGGRVVGNTLECPHHHFRYDCHGRGQQGAPAHRAYAVAERFAAIFVFLGDTPTFPLPSFGEDDLISAPPVHWYLRTQWYMVAANGFDARHFAEAHGRRLVAPPRVHSSDNHCVEVMYRYHIDARGWLDRAVRIVSGSEVEFRITAWGGNFLLAHARFARDESLGVVVIEPDAIDGRGSKVTLIVSARRSRTALGALLTDHLGVHAKRFAIRRFLQQDAHALRNLEYAGGGLCPGDETLAYFLRWAASVPEA